MPLTTDTTQATAVAGAVLENFARCFPKADTGLIQHFLADADSLFNGRHRDYQACDLKYHDYRHTLQVTVCCSDLLAARAASPSGLDQRHFELGVAAALLHDTGYLKMRHDEPGTGAKYTYCHVLRSCALAASHLPARGLNLEEVDIVLGAIRRTGPLPPGSIPRTRTEFDQFVACAVASADYLAQMSATDYPDELGLLYAEFAESDDFAGVPPPRRTFKSATDLHQRTGKFWSRVVLPKLDKDFLGVYHLLDESDGTNPWLAAIERNLATIAKHAP